LYGEDRPALLAVGELLLRWPLTIVALLLTLAYLGRVNCRTTQREPKQLIRARCLAGADDCWWPAHRSRSNSRP
jgi:hypothetical protein